MAGRHDEAGTGGSATMDRPTMSDAISEAAIIRVLAGEVEAFSLLVDRHEWPLRAWLSGRCPPEVDETELAHRAFVRAFEVLATYRQGESFRAWLIGIARHLLLAECKKLRNRAEGDRRYGEMLLCGAQERLVEDEDPQADAGSQELDALSTCLDQLPDHLRELIDARYVREEPVKDLAERLGRSEGAIKKHLFVIRRQLHECIGRRLGQELAS